MYLCSNIVTTAFYLPKNLVSDFKIAPLSSCKKSSCAINHSSTQYTRYEAVAKLLFIKSVYVLFVMNNKSLTIVVCNNE